MFSNLSQSSYLRIYGSDWCVMEGLVMVGVTGIDVIVEFGEVVESVGAAIYSRTATLAFGGLVPIHQCTVSAFGRYYHLHYCWMRRRHRETMKYSKSTIYPKSHRSHIFTPHSYQQPSAPTHQQAPQSAAHSYTPPSQPPHKPFSTPHLSTQSPHPQDKSAH